VLGDILTKDLLEEMEDDMGDETPEMIREPSQGSSKKKSFIKRLLGNKKRLLLILVIGLVLMGTLGGIWFFFLRGTSEDSSLSGENRATEQGVLAGSNGSDKSDVIDEIVFEDIVVLEPFERIPLKTDSAMGLISLNISLELIDHRYRKQVYSVQDRIRKIIMGQVREMRWLELRNPEGKIQLKYELLKEINTIFPKAMVRNIYFTNLIMQ